MRQINDSEKNPRAAVLEFFRRLHFYIGLFIGPFIFVAALTGTLYVFSHQIEKSVYAHELIAEPQGNPQSLAEQIAAARDYVGKDAKIYAVRPAPGPTDTTRVQFVDPALGASESRAVFVDPYTLAIRGDLTVYGSSGSLPLRKWIDQVHRGLLLGDLGRNYSELAASWMWVAAVGGIVLWRLSRPKRQLKKARGRLAASRRLHITLGLFLLAGLLMFSATGLTWSQWAGSNIDKMRAAFNWLTPQVNTLLAPAASTPDSAAMPGHDATAGHGTQHDHTAMPGHDAAAGHGNQHDHAAMSGHDAAAGHETQHDHMAMPGHDAAAHHAAASQAAVDPHAEHRMPMSALTLPAQDNASWQQVLAAARQAGIDSARVEIRGPKSEGRAWTVTENEAHWPSQVDAVAVDPQGMRVVDYVHFEQYPLAAKLTRWGIDFHMGLLFGLPNQLLLIAFGLGTCAMIVLGYRMWWLRRPSAPTANSASSLLQAWLALPLRWRLASLLVAAVLAVCLPVMGASLVVFLLIDFARGRQQRQPIAPFA